MAIDPIFEAWLEENCARGLALARDSDLLELTPVGGNPPQKYRAEFRCRGLIRDAGGNIVEAGDLLSGGLPGRGGCLPSLHLARAALDLAKQHPTAPRVSHSSGSRQ
jgi:hypothetical protein